MKATDTESLLYLDTPEQVELFLDDISGVREIALDTEGASFHRFIDRIYLLQITTRERSAVIDPLPIGCPGSAGRNPRGSGGRGGVSRRRLRPATAAPGLRLARQRNIFDTRIAAQLLGIKAFGLAALLEQFFGVKLDKKHQRADWSLRPLTAGMLDYAAQDTRYLLDLRDELTSRLEKLGRSEWAREEFERLEGTKWEPEDDAHEFPEDQGRARSHPP